MAASPAHPAVETLIKQLKCYGSQNARVVQDVNNLLRQTNSLACQIGQLVHNDGRSSTLLQLYGTVPIYYKDRQYNIPVQIWLVENYPAVPPTCYVTPTKEMRVSHKHRHVDPMGLIYLPYLNQWNMGTSTLAELVLSMITVFSEEPPVFRAEDLFASKATIAQHKPAAAPTPAAAAAAAAAAQSDAAARKKNTLVQQATTKLQTALGALHKETAGDIDQLLEQQNGLKQSEQKIKSTIASLKEQQAALTTRLAVLSAKTEEVSAWLAEHEHDHKRVEVESLVFPKDSWGQQLIEQVAEDHAIEDTLYALDKALSKERIDAKIFMKQVRKLATQQFFARALAIKIQQKQAETQAKPPPPQYPYGAKLESI